MHVTGIMGTTSDYERYLEAASVDVIGTGSVAPLMMTDKVLGGQDFDYDSTTGAGQQGVKAWRWVVTEPGDVLVRQFSYVQGLNNLGLLVRVAGTVNWVDSASFHVDDGSGYDDFETPDPTQNMPSGVQVMLPDGVQPPTQGSYVIITGISSCRASGSNALRLLRVWRAQDVQVVQPGAGSITGDTLLEALPGIWVGRAFPFRMFPARRGPLPWDCWSFGAGVAGGDLQQARYSGGRSPNQDLDLGT